MDIYIIVALIGLAITAAVAAGKNRSVIGWAALGFLVPLIGVIAIMLAAPLARPEDGHAS
jgi:hypothetical protein